MATIGLRKSPSFIPVARQSAGAGHALRPWVVVLLRNFATVFLLGELND
ncbi:MAG: hypothetical protein R2867_27040 [Caldilineaceae bacterium]